MPDNATTTELTIAAEPLLVKPADAARLLGMSRSTLDKLEASGVIGPRPIRFGGKVLWSLTELRKWIEAGCPGRVEWNAQTNEPKPRLAATG